MRLTVAIATWNRAPLLARTLASLGSLRVPAGVDWELLVCDNRSTDHTRTIADGAAERLPLRYLYEPTQGKSHALNRIIAQSTGQWVLFLDDDVHVNPGWLAAYCAGMERHPRAACLGGPIEPWTDEPLTARQSFLIERYPGVFGVLPVEVDTPMARPEPTAFGANMAVRRDAFPAEGFSLERGMFQGRRVAGEDVAMIHHCLAAGHEGWLLPDAGVGHYLPPGSIGMRRFCHWHAGIGRTWLQSREPAAAGLLGVPWWAWRRCAARAARAAARWRPEPTADFFEALADTAQFWGYLHASRGARRGAV